MGRYQFKTTNIKGKQYVEVNERIKYYFGDLKGRKWTEDDIELKNNCKLISKSNL